MPRASVRFVGEQRLALPAPMKGAFYAYDSFAADLNELINQLDLRDVALAGTAFLQNFFPGFCRDTCQGAECADAGFPEVLIGSKSMTADPPVPCTIGSALFVTSTRV